MIAVADTGPVQYLIETEAIQELPRLYSKLILPLAVVDELMEPGAPASIHSFLAAPPWWLEVWHLDPPDSGTRRNRGEREAIATARRVSADRLLVDDQEARRAAREQFGDRIIGTIAVLVELSRLDDQPLRLFDTYIARLRLTSFRFSSSLEDTLHLLRDQLGDALPPAQSSLE